MDDIENAGIIPKVFSFCDHRSLLALDLTTRRYRKLTKVCFAKLAMNRFGISSVDPQEKDGKKIWRKGLALVNPNKHFVVPLAHPAEYVFEPRRTENPLTYAGLQFCTVTTHPSSSIISYEIDPWFGGNFQELSGSNSIFLRDSETLSFIRPESMPFRVPAWDLAICGPSEYEVFVARHNSHFIAYRRGQSQTLQIPKNQSNEVDTYLMFDDAATTNVIGNAQYLIIVCAQQGKAGALHVFRYTGRISSNLLSFFTTIKLDDILVGPMALVWGSPEIPGVFALLQDTTAMISVWKVSLEEETSNQSEHNNALKEIERIDTAVPFRNAAVGERYIAGAADGETNPDKFRIRLYKRSSRTEVHILQEPDVDLLMDDLIGPPCMEFIGDLLLSTSIVGNWLCVWNATDGTLLARHKERELHSDIDLANDSGYRWTRSFVRLHNTKSMSFLTASGSKLRLWSFPYDWRGKTLSHNLAIREAALEGLRNSFDFEQDPTAFEAEDD